MLIRVAAPWAFMTCLSYQFRYRTLFVRRRPNTQPWGLKDNLWLMIRRHENLNLLCGQYGWWRNEVNLAVAEAQLTFTGFGMALHAI